MELVTPPLPLDRLHEVQRLIELLRKAGATGTSDNLTNAFGMQFNPEVPAEDAATITDYLKAFLCLQEWLVERADVNVARRATTYIDANPTRNRTLDMLPLFIHLDESRVRAATADPLIKPRPTFHYRLPDCDISKPGWGLDLAWNDWVEVERLAADRDRLDACCRAYTRFLNRPLKRWLGNWPKEVSQHWLSR